MTKQYELNRIQFSLEDSVSKEVVSTLIDSVKEAEKERVKRRKNTYESLHRSPHRLAHRDVPFFTQESLLSRFGIKEEGEDRLTVELSYLTISLNPVQAHFLEGYWQFLNNHFPEFDIHKYHYRPIQAPRLLAIELLQRLAALLLSSNDSDEAFFLEDAYSKFHYQIRRLSFSDESSMFSTFNKNKSLSQIFYFEQWSSIFSSYAFQINQLRSNVHNVNLAFAKLDHCEKYLRQRIVLELKPHDKAFLKSSSLHKAQYLAEQEYLEKPSAEKESKDLSQLFNPAKFLSLTSDKEKVLKGYNRNNPRSSFFSSNQSLEQEGVAHLQKAYELLEETQRYQACNQRLSLLVDSGNLIPWFSECINLRGWVEKVLSHMEVCRKFLQLEDAAWLNQQSAAKYQDLWGFFDMGRFSDFGSSSLLDEEVFRLVLTQNSSYALKVKEARECSDSLGVNLINKEVKVLFDEIFPEGAQSNRQAESLSSSSSALFARRSSGSVSHGGGAAAEVGKRFF